MKIKHSKRNRDAAADLIAADDRYLALGPDDQSEANVSAIIMLEDLAESFRAMLTDERRYVRFSPNAIGLILKIIAASRTATLNRIEKQLKEDAQNGD